MKSKKSLYITIGILIFILVATICPDCTDESDTYEELEWQKSKKLAEGMSEEEATAAAKKVVEKEQAVEAYDEDTSSEYLNGDDEDEKTPIPDEPITYSGDLWDVGIDLIVDFKTKVVSGSLSQSGDPYVNAKIDGTINIETFKVTTTFSGVVGAPEYGREEPFNGTINGIISDDLSTFNGILLDDEGESGEITLTK